MSKLPEYSEKAFKDVMEREMIIWKWMIKTSWDIEHSNEFLKFKETSLSILKILKSSIFFIIRRLASYISCYEYLSDFTFKQSKAKPEHRTFKVYVPIFFKICSRQKFLKFLFSNSF